uniref:Alpha amylase, catalytic domain n=1 Tax=Candidatus Kentrum sp. LPFa TaxID=2126335 RepID=A0A450XHV7_9GAMM|nr:MAG: Alpha amylase, catalytic domain [Candidatus Kentron sp. LPFa]VFK28856.1 MAG: Alpha amylase, catalytic domain [Candidatus Kentron sp. LPFa]
MITFGTQNLRPGTDIVDAGLDKEILFGLGFTPDEASINATPAAFLWTNLGSEAPDIFREVAMEPVKPSDDHRYAFAVTLPLMTPGTYTATAFVRHGSEEEIWVGKDVNWRISVPAVDSLYVRQIPIDKANARQDSGKISTMDDMLDGPESAYTLDKMQQAGVNCLWIQTPYRIDPWDGRPNDTAGSDYASTDWFSIDPELSREASRIPGWDTDRQHEIANQKMKEFVTAAHARGMKVVFGIAPNHVGHNYIFRDFFQDEDVVKRGCYKKIVIDEFQPAEVEKRKKQYAGTELALYAEYIFPWMFATKNASGEYDPNGANDVNETYSPDWAGNWDDTKHLNHGAHAGQGHRNATTEQNWKVLAYIGNAMLWVVVKLGVDGFRIDHSYGMPVEFFTQTIPWVEKKARALRPGFEGLILFHEEHDHERKRFAANVGDVIQAKWYEAILQGFSHRDVEAIWSAYGNPYFAEFSGTGNHDECRGITFFTEFSRAGNHDECKNKNFVQANLREFGNAVVTMLFLGGPMTTLAGDEYGESRKLRFKMTGGIPTLWQARTGQLAPENLELDAWVSKAGRLRRERPELGCSERERLIPRSDDPVPIVAFEKRASENLCPLMVFSNIDHGNSQSGRFGLGARARAWIGLMVATRPDTQLQVKDLFSSTPDQPLWSHPILARDLLRDGIQVDLTAYQVQVLEMARV